MTERQIFTPDTMSETTALQPPDDDMQATALYLGGLNRIYCQAGRCQQYQDMLPLNMPDGSIDVVDHRSGYVISLSPSSNAYSVVMLDRDGFTLQSDPYEPIPLPAGLRRRDFGTAHDYVWSVAAALRTRHDEPRSALMFGLHRASPFDVTELFDNRLQDARPLYI